MNNFQLINLFLINNKFPFFLLRNSNVVLFLTKSTILRLFFSRPITLQIFFTLAMRIMKKYKKSLAINNLLILKNILNAVSDIIENC